MADGDIAPCLPEQDRLRLAVLGKLIEECNELSARAARCILHGIDEHDPDTSRSNRAELEREMADVYACLGVARTALEVDPSAARMNAKIKGFYRWHRMIAESPDGVRQC